MPHDEDIPQKPNKTPRIEGSLFIERKKVEVIKRMFKKVV